MDSWIEGFTPRGNGQQHIQRPNYIPAPKEYKILWRQLGQKSELKVTSNSIITHCIGIDITTSSLLLGTRQMQFVPKLVSRVWMHRRQHKFSYPCFFHFAIRFLSAYPSLIQYSYSSVRKMGTGHQSMVSAGPPLAHHYLIKKDYLANSVPSPPFLVVKKNHETCWGC